MNTQTRRCKHNRVEIIEEFVAYSWHTYEGGVLVENYNSEEGGDYTGMFDVKCHDCGFCGRFSSKTAPKWVERLTDLLTGSGAD